MNPEHIPLKERTTLSARLIGFPIIQIEASTSFNARAKIAVKALQADLVFLSAEGLEQDVTGNLDTFLATLMRNLHAKTTPLLGRSEDQAVLVQKLLAAIETGIQRVCCEKCASRRELICNGRNVDEDSKIVAQSGQCMLPLKEMFDAAEGAARAYYRRFSTIFSKFSPLVEVVLSTRACNGKPHEFPVPYQVSGATFFDDHDTWKTHVFLDLWVKAFDWETYMSCLYVLFHECICHAFINKQWPPLCRLHGLFAK